MDQNHRSDATYVLKTFRTIEKTNKWITAMVKLIWKTTMKLWTNRCEHERMVEDQFLQRQLSTHIQRLKIGEYINTRDKFLIHEQQRIAESQNTNLMQDWLERVSLSQSTKIIESLTSTLVQRSITHYYHQTI